MAKSQELANFEQVVEKIIFNDDELTELKIAIKNFTEGKISEKELKHLLLQCRGRMVEEMRKRVKALVASMSGSDGRRNHGFWLFLCGEEDQKTNSNRKKHTATFFTV